MVKNIKTKTKEKRRRKVKIFFIFYILEMNGQPKEPEVTPVVNPTDDGIDMSSCCCCY